MPGSRRRTLGFMAPAVHGFFWGSVFSGILQTAAARGGRVVAVQTFDAGFLAYPDEGYTAHLGWHHFDALVIGEDPVPDSYLREYARTGKPVVALYRRCDDPEYPVVRPDNYAGIRLVTEHLIEHGHREIAFVGREPPDDDQALRYRAYRETMLAHGLTPTEPVTMPWQLDETYDGSVAVRRLQSRGRLPSAAVAATDLSAMALVTALAKIGVSVPGDMAVTGFDDIADAATFSPPLSTVAQSFQLAGATASRLAFDALDGSPAEPGMHCTQVTLVCRESCGCSGETTQERAPVLSGTELIQARGGDALGGLIQVRLVETLVDVLVNVVQGTRQLARSRRRDITPVVERLAELLTTVARAPGGDTDVSGALHATAGDLRELIAESPNPARVVGAIRQFAQALVEQVTPDDEAASARCDRFVLDLAIQLLERKNLDARGRPIVAAENIEAQRRYFMIGTDLVSRRRSATPSLQWLETTEFRAGCLALWDRGDGNRDGRGVLRIISSYDKAGRYREEPGSCDARAFPPPPFVDLMEESDGDGEHVYVYVLPVCFGRSDWGFLALTGSLDPLEAAVFERYNHWAVLLTVAFDHEQAIHSEHALLDEIRISEERYALAAEAANDGLWDWNLASGTIFYSSRWKFLLGYAEDEIAATVDEWLDRVHPDDRGAVDRMLAQHLDGRAATTELEYRLRTADGTYRWMLTHARSMRDETGQAIRLIGSMTDVTDRKRLEERLRHEAYYDPLTSLPNRKFFLDRLNQALERTGSHPGYRFAVVFFDLNGFKVINDSLGHQVGDAVLKQVAARLTREVRPEDTVARFGGDEFVLLLDDIRGACDTQATVTRILSAISAPLTIDGRVLTVSSAAGVAASTTGTRTADEYLRDADTAMYQAKTAGGGNYVLFDRSMHTVAVRRLQLESGLRQAVAENEFTLYYQPILRLRDRRAVGTEALIRWLHPEHGMISPGEFLPVAESTGLIREIGQWTIETVCRQIRAWLAASPAFETLTVSVNLSNRQFWAPELRSQLHRALARHGVPAAMLVFEVTEGVIMHNHDAASTLLQQLRDDGIRLHVDDFGTGYSSLAALHSFPIDAMKIDRSFVSRMGTDGRSRELVRTMIDMGRNLGIQVIAEGVETESEAAILADLGCPLVQGYLFGRPLPASEIRRYVLPAELPSDAAAA